MFKTLKRKKRRIGNRSEELKRKGRSNERDEELKRKQGSNEWKGRVLQRKDGRNEMDVLKGKEMVNEPDLRLKTKGKQ
jgi:hypothetical protein